jgi:hypothetical protein
MLNAVYIVKDLFYIENVIKDYNILENKSITVMKKQKYIDQIKYQINLKEDN